MKKLKVLAVLMLVLILVTTYSSSAFALVPADPGNHEPGYIQNSGEVPAIDGDLSDWAVDVVFAPMYEAGNPAKTHMGDLYLRYDCSTNMLYALVVLLPDHRPASGEEGDAWAKIYDAGFSASNNKLVDGGGGCNTGNCAFEWIQEGDVLVGYEAQARLSPADVGAAGFPFTVNEFEAHINKFDGSTVSTGKGAQGNAISLTIDCGDICQDTDGDGVCDDQDICPGFDDNVDTDGDGVPDGCDNCAGTYNPDQADGDQDGVGDVCDNCVDTPNPDQADGDQDGVGDVCDNCVDTPNPDQADVDQDGVGDVCDNCPDTPNPDQADSNQNGIGDACEVVIIVEKVVVIPEDLPHPPLIIPPDGCPCGEPDKDGQCPPCDLPDIPLPDFPCLPLPPLDGICIPDGNDGCIPIPDDMPLPCIPLPGDGQEPPFPMPDFPDIPWDPHMLDWRFVIGGGSIIPPQEFGLPPLGGMEVFEGLEGGSYNIMELPTPFFRTDSVCTLVGGPSLAQGDNQIGFDIAGGEVVECTFYNTLELGWLRVEKELVYGKQAPPPGPDWLFTMETPFLPFPLMGTLDYWGEAVPHEPFLFFPVPVGGYSITELSDDPAFRTFAGCFDPAAPPDELEEGKSVSFEIEANDVVVCTFVNEYEPSTAITMPSSSFLASGQAGRVTVAWQTETELDNAGFNVYRGLSSEGPWMLINEALIPAKGDAFTGASYTFQDVTGFGTFYYQLEAVDLNGATSIHGPIVVDLGAAVRAPRFRPLLPNQF